MSLSSHLLYSSRSLSVLTCLSQPSTPPEALLETLSILLILISRFPNHISTATYSPPPLVVLAPLLSHQRPVVRKRAIVTLSQFIPISPPALFSDLLRSNVLPNLTPSAGLEKQRTTVQLIAAVARHSPSQIAPILDKIVPSILEAVGKDDDELREGSLQALEALILRCPTETDSYLPTIVEAGNKYIKHDPVCRLIDLSFLLPYAYSVFRIMQAMTGMKKWQTRKMKQMTKTKKRNSMSKFTNCLWTLSHSKKDTQMTKILRIKFVAQQRNCWRRSLELALIV